MADEKVKVVASIPKELGEGGESPSLDTLFREISLTGGVTYKAPGILDYNPDDLVGRKGLQIYSKMMHDDQIKAVLTMKKFARLMSPWSVQPATEDPKDIEIADFVKYNIEKMQGTFEDVLLNILTALEFGFSVSEEVWKRIEVGQWAGKIGLKAIKTRKPFYYDFETDEFGNLREDGVIFSGSYYPQLGPVTNPTTASWLKGSAVMNNTVFGVRLPTNKFVIYSYQKTFDNPYGTSDLRSSYRSFFSKELLIRFMNIYMERFGMPTHVGKVPKGTKKIDRDALQSVLDRVQAKYSIVIPEDISIDLLSAGASGETGFSNAIEMHNRFIARSILVPDLLGFTQSLSGGTYALGKKHFDVFLWILKKLGKDIEETIVGEQIIRRLVDLNYAGIERYPFFQFEDVTEEGTQIKAMIIAAGVNAGFIDPAEGWIRDYLSLPEVEEGAQLGAPLQGAEPIPGMEGVGTETPEFNVDGTLKEVVKESQVSRYYDALHKRYFEKSFKDKVFSYPRKYQKEDVKVKPTKFDKKLDYVKVKKELDIYEAESSKALGEIVQRQKDALLKDIEKKRILEDGVLSEINKLQLKYVGDFKKELENRIVKVYFDSKLEMAKELVESDVPLDLRVLFQGAVIQNWEPVVPSEAVDFFNRKVLAKIIKKDGTKKLVELASRKELPYYSAKAFAIAGIERDYILKEAKEILLAGIKSGDNTEARFNLEELFNSYLETGELKDDKLVTPQRLNIIVRQNVSEAMNSGRRAMMEDPDVADEIPYFQFTSIMDDRVRPNHAYFHGNIYKASDPIWNIIWPPLSWGCRCTVIGVTKSEVDAAGGVEIGSHKLPPGIPDPDFIKFSEDTKVRVKSYSEVPLKLKEDGSLDSEALLKAWEEASKDSIIEEPISFTYEWVTKCPYRSCGSSNIKPIKILDGALVYTCGACNHQFKVLQEGDVYFYDIGKEEWQNANLMMRPSYFIAEVESKKYYFTKKELLDQSIEKVKELGADISRIKILEG